MALKWNDPELETLNARWRRWGELMATAGVTGAFTWLAAALPTANTTHVNIWPPIIVVGLIAIAGIYAIVCAESGRGWLPKRRNVLSTQAQRLVAETAAKQFENIPHGTSTDRAILDTTTSIAKSVDRMAKALENMDKRGQR